MNRELTTLLDTSLDDIIQAALERLKGTRPELLCEPGQLELEVRRCGLALSRAATTDDAAVLVAAAVAVGLENSNPSRGYRRVQLLLDALCTATADIVRRSLPRPDGRTAMSGLRALLGPAQLGLAEVVRNEPTPVSGRVWS